MASLSPRVRFPFEYAEARILRLLHLHVVARRTAGEQKSDADRDSECQQWNQKDGSHLRIRERGQTDNGATPLRRSLIVALDFSAAELIVASQFQARPNCGQHVEVQPLGGAVGLLIGWRKKKAENEASTTQHVDARSGQNNKGRQHGHAIRTSLGVNSLPLLVEGCGFRKDIRVWSIYGSERPVGMKAINSGGSANKPR
jgi:hypothetical protein